MVTFLLIDMALEAAMGLMVIPDGEDHPQVAEVNAAVGMKARPECRF